MSITIFDLGQCVRKASAAAIAPVQLGHSHQLVVAALGYKTLASFQAAQAASEEPPNLLQVRNVVLDYGRLEQRADELGLTLAPSRLHELVTAAFRERAPYARIHRSYDAFETYLREWVVQIAIENEKVAREMANANFDGVNEVYLEFDIEWDQISVDGALAVDIVGHIGLGIDTERPYAGHIVNIESNLSVERFGRQCFGAPDFQITRAELDTDWGDDDQEVGPPIRSTSKAYADLLGIELDEVGELTGVEVEPRSGNSDDMITGYLLDFTDLASPEMAQKILQRHASLRFEVGPNFFDNVRSDDWPR